VPFVSELPEPEPDDVPSQAFPDHPWSRSEQGAPGCGQRGSRRRPQRATVVRLVVLNACPGGVSVAVQALLNPTGGQLEHLPRRPSPFVASLRIGMRWTDGRRVGSTQEWDPQVSRDGGADPDGFTCPWRAAAR